MDADPISWGGAGPHPGHNPRHFRAYRLGTKGTGDSFGRYAGREDLHLPSHWRLTDMASKEQLASEPYSRSNLHVFPASIPHLGNEKKPKLRSPTLRCSFTVTN